MATDGGGGGRSQTGRGGGGGGGGGRGGRRRKHTAGGAMDDDDDPDMRGANGNNSLIVNGFQQRTLAAARHKALQEHEIRVVHDPSQATACNDLVALDQHRRDRTTIEDLYLERAQEKEAALKRVKKAHGGKMVDLFGVEEVEEKRATTPPRSPAKPKPARSASSQAKPRAMARPSGQVTSTNYTSPWAPRNDDGSTRASSTSIRSNPVKPRPNPPDVAGGSSKMASSSLSMKAPSSVKSNRPTPSKDVRQQTSSANIASNSMRANHAKRPRRSTEDVYDDTDEDEDDYGDDDGDDRKGTRHDYSSVIQSIFGYNRHKYIDDDSDVDDMEASIHDIKREETHSTRVAREEDEREAELERLEMERIAARRKKKRLQQLAS
ncbi:SPT2 chromatin protein-domain-containing protein [Syncephalis pseudoplumigaleata]|uniref:SPT2 chromatin protein-domain-containing protein n=1 Tax=Syncephalis pseudoplumigaleata TaxID=1712513 RepID=A0A4P9Z394_9FUNG|nr:SPT2 chromatin protein-domain-containing protein [Syncephalis pseudoplumigaleata]|eukprot:RKP26875.1 SPT2 chromatin protein-domain-containing protein [Syncephalis pseudoplumigaleata]